MNKVTDGVKTFAMIEHYFINLGGSIIWHNEGWFDKLEGWFCLTIKKWLNYIHQAFSAAFENPSNYTNEDMGTVEELMQVKGQIWS